MARDIKELLAARLMAILGDSEIGFASVWRDRGDVPKQDIASDPPTDLLPAGVLLDKKAIPLTDTRGHHPGAPQPSALWSWEPEIWVLLMPCEDATNAGQAELLVAFHNKLVKAIQNDEPLLLALGSSGEINYRGFETDMQSGGGMEGQMRLDYAFSYMFDPSDL